MKLLLRLLLNNLRKGPPKGFTLTEMLVSMFIGSLITTALVAMTVELSNSDQTEAALSQTQQDMQLGLDYIKNDLKGAVYIYDGTQTENQVGTTPPPPISIYTYLPSFGTYGNPIFAFWKAEPVTQFPTSCTGYTGNLRDECELLKIKRLAYTLVVYLQSTSTDPRWRGKSRILRYALPKYQNSATLTKSTGFVDPAIYNNFATWPKDRNNATPSEYATPSLSENTPVVLVDFVDDPTSNGDGYLPTCPTDSNALDNINDSYQRSPKTALESTSKSFYTCIRTVGNDYGLSQDVILYLRGNASGRNGLVDSVKGFIPMIQTRVSLRGVIDKYE